MSGPKTPVDAAGVEAQAEEALLQLGDVVPVDEMAGGVPQQPVAEPPASRVERGEGPGADDPVDEQPALLLEGADRGVEPVVEGLGRAVERRLGRLRRQRTRGDEPVAEVTDHGSPVAETGREAGTRFGHVPPLGNWSGDGRLRGSRRAGAGLGGCWAQRTIADRPPYSAPTPTGFSEPADAGDGIAQLAM